MHGLYLLWWVQERHVPVAVVATILAAGDVAVTALEVPTGWLADRYGHRASLIAGSLLQIAGMLFCWLGVGTTGLLSASLLVAFGDAFRSGADQALLYRSCVALDRQSDFQRIEAKSRALQLVALVALTLAGGAIVETWGFAIGWLVETMVCSAGLTIAWAMVEPPSRGGSISSGDAVMSRARIARSLRQHVVDLAPVIQLIVPAALLAGAGSAASFLAQTTRGTDPGRLSVFVAIVTLAEAGGSTLAAHLAANVRSQLILASLGAAIAAAAFALPQMFLPAVIGLSFLVGVAPPLRAAAMQKMTADGVRARAASIANACDKAVTTVALVCAGSLPRRR